MASTGWSGAFNTFAPNAMNWNERKRSTEYQQMTDALERARQAKIDEQNTQITGAQLQQYADAAAARKLEEDERAYRMKPPTLDDVTKWQGWNTGDFNIVGIDPRELSRFKFWEPLLKKRPPTMPFPERKPNLIPGYNAAGPPNPNLLGLIPNENISYIGATGPKLPSEPYSPVPTTPTGAAGYVASLPPDVLGKATRLFAEYYGAGTTPQRKYEITNWLTAYGLNKTERINALLGMMNTSKGTIPLSPALEGATPSSAGQGNGGASPLGAGRGFSALIPDAKVVTPEWLTPPMTYDEMSAERAQYGNELYMANYTPDMKPEDKLKLLSWASGEAEKRYPTNFYAMPGLRTNGVDMPYTGINDLKGQLPISDRYSVNGSAPMAIEDYTKLFNMATDYPIQYKLPNGQTGYTSLKNLGSELRQGWETELGFGLLANPKLAMAVMNARSGAERNDALNALTSFMMQTYYPGMMAIAQQNADTSANKPGNTLDAQFNATHGKRVTSEGSYNELTGETEKFVNLKDAVTYKGKPLRDYNGHIVRLVKGQPPMTDAEKVQYIIDLSRLQLRDTNGAKTNKQGRPTTLLGVFKANGVTIPNDLGI